MLDGRLNCISSLAALRHGLSCPRGRHRSSTCLKEHQDRELGEKMELVVEQEEEGSCYGNSEIAVFTGPLAPMEQIARSPAMSAIE